MFGFISAARQQYRALAVMVACLLFAGGAHAQNFTFSQDGENAVVARAGEVGEVSFTLSLETPWYIYAPTGINEDQGLIETRLVMRPNKDIQFADAVFPPAESFGTYDVLRGSGNAVKQSFRVRPRTPAGDYPVKGFIEYQTCDGTICLPPNRASVKFTIRVVE